MILISCIVTTELLLFDFPVDVVDSLREGDISTDSEVDLGDIRVEDEVVERGC